MQNNLTQSNLTQSNVVGCVLGVALGDAYGAPYEGGPLERGLWMLIQAFSKDILYTDDTQTTLDVINSINDNNGVDADDIADKMSMSYTWFKGYGKNTAKILKRIRKGHKWSDINESVFAGGSFGNGAAIRTLPIGLFFTPDFDANKAKLKSVSSQVASITHAHELGRHGAFLMSLTVALVINNTSSKTICEILLEESEGSPYRDKLLIAEKWLNAGQMPDIKVVRAQLGNSVSALESVVTAIFLALSYFEQPIESLLDKCIKLGGDTDSIASMACGLWGAKNGHQAISPQLVERIENYNAIVLAAKKLYITIEDV